MAQWKGLGGNLTGIFMMATYDGFIRSGFHLISYRIFILLPGGGFIAGIKFQWYKVSVA